MPIRSGFFNSINGDRKYDARWFAEYFASFIGNGVFPNPSTNLQVIESTNMQTVVKSGKGWINGYYVTNDSDYILQHDIADGVLKRIDRIVMRLNYLTREIEIVVKKGTFASIPVAPTLQRDSDAFELALADVFIGNGTTQITQANITDQRLNNEVCGIVQGVVKQVDTTTVFNQFQSWFYRKTQDYEAAFVAWLEEFNDVLDEETAINLLNLININKANLESHRTAPMPHQFRDDVTGQVYNYGFKAVNGIVTMIYEEVVD